MAEIVAKLSSPQLFKKNYLHIIIALAVFLAIRFLLPPGNGLTDKGVTVLALFVATIWLWLFVGIDWTSLLVVVVMIMTGVLSQTDMLAVSFGNFCFAYVMAGMLLNTALVDTGVIPNIASWFITRDICKGRPWVFVTLFLFSLLFLQLFLDCTPVTLMYLTLIEGVCKELGYEKGSSFGRALVVAVLWLVAVGYAATPISHPIAVIMLGYLATINHAVSFAQFMAIGVSFALVFFVLTILALKVIVKPDFSKFSSYDPEEHRKKIKPLSTQAKICLGVFIAVVIMWLLPDATKQLLPGISAYFSQVGLVAPPLLGVVLLSIIRTNRNDAAGNDGEAVALPILDIKKKIYEISIPTLIFIVGIQAFANTINSPVTGVSTYLGNLFLPVAHSVSTGSLVFICMLLAIAITQLISTLLVQTLTWSAFLPVILSVNASGGDINIAAFGMILTLIVSISFMFPSAYVCAPLCYNSGYLEPKDGLRISAPVVVISYLLLMLVFWPIANHIL